MKKFVKLEAMRSMAGIIALAAVIGFSMAACGGDDGGGGTGNLDAGWFEPTTTGSAYRVVNNGTPPNAVVIPASYNGKPVREIAGAAFRNCANLVSVSIPSTVTYIGDSAFRGCTRLTGVAIPNGVTRILSQTFYGCTSLASVTIPASVTTIYNSAFSGCTSLARVTIPESVTTIYTIAFSGCTSLASVTFNGTITADGFGTNTFPGDLIDKYLAGGPGTYTRSAGSNTWTKR
jgi:hypothetical protein